MAPAMLAFTEKQSFRPSAGRRRLGEAGRGKYRGLRRRASVRSEEFGVGALESASTADSAQHRESDALDDGGRIVVMAYQSLEDRIVKHALRDATTDSTPLGVPAALPEHAAPYRLLLRGAEMADDAERARNPRSIPVRLRAAERIGGGA